jgi:hypothetical protein
MNASLLPAELCDRVETYADRAAWLAARSGRTPQRIGGSDVAGILGLPAFRTGWDLFRERVEGFRREPTPAERAVLERGQRWEPVVLGEYAALHHPVLGPGEAFGHPGAITIVVHPEKPWAVCSPDGFVVHPLLGVGGAEAKTDLQGDGWTREDVVLYSAADYSEEVAPPAYVAQSYHCLEVTGLPFWDLVCLSPRYEIRVVRIMADPAHQATVLAKVGAWRQRHLLDREPPPPDDSESCAGYYRARFRGVDEGSREATAEERIHAEALVDGRALEARGKAIANGARGALLAAMATHTHLSGPGWGVRRDKRGAVTVYGADQL